MRVVVALLLAACAAKPRCELPTRPHGAPFLWRAQRDGGPIVWLFGTIHDAGAADVPRDAWTALESSRQFASELGDAEPDPQQLVELARLPFGQVLDQQLSADDWFDLVEAMRGAMAADALRHARPWFAMVRLNGQMAHSPKPSMDVALAERARSRSIAVDHLETWKEQIDALATTVTSADLSRAIHDRSNIACELAHLRAAYDAGDVPALERSLLPAGPVLLAERNRKWLPQLERYFATGAFVAVGLGHMLGDSGLPALLASDGYTVERYPL